MAVLDVVEQQGFGFLHNELNSAVGAMASRIITGKLAASCLRVYICVLLFQKVCNTMYICKKRWKSVEMSDKVHYIQKGFPIKRKGVEK